MTRKQYFESPSVGERIAERILQLIPTMANVTPPSYYGLGLSVTNAAGLHDGGKMFAQIANEEVAAEKSLERETPTTSEVVNAETGYVYQFLRDGDVIQLGDEFYSNREWHDAREFIGQKWRTFNAPCRRRVSLTSSLPKTPAATEGKEESFGAIPTPQGQPNLETGLAPCPFCGGHAVLAGRGNFDCYVACPKCDVRIHGGSIESTAASWNRREPQIPSPSPQSTVAQGKQKVVIETPILHTSKECEIWRRKLENPSSAALIEALRKIAFDERMGGHQSNPSLNPRLLARHVLALAGQEQPQPKDLEER